MLHWIFAFKYWSLSLKMEIISVNGDPDSLNTLFYIMFYIGLLLNMLAGISYCMTWFYPDDPKLYLTATIL